MGNRICPYCNEAILTGRRVQCGKPECQRAYNNARQKRYHAAYKARTGTDYRRRYARGTRGSRESKRARDRKYRSKRRALLRGVSVAEVVPDEIFERDGWRCGICGRKVRQALRYPHPMCASLDHIVPLAEGGVHAPENVQCSHLACNIAKSHTGSGQLRLIG